jgi:hypothetical protein
MDIKPRLLVYLGLVVIVAACNMTPTPTPEACVPILAVSPENVGPANGTVTNDVRPVLTWTYPNGCDPEMYVVNLATNATVGGTVTELDLSGTTADATTSWAPGEDLTPGHYYLWSVAAKNSTIVGPPSGGWIFFEGPLCGPAGLLAPIPDTPSLNASADSLNPKYTWHYPESDCTPGGYLVTVSTDPNFASGIVYDPALNHPYMDWRTSIPLQDCTTYYWRVAARSGVDSGPWSETAEFRVDATGHCSCQASDLVQPVPVSPTQYSIVPDLIPILEWNNPGTCDPEGYAVHLSSIYDMSDTSLFGATGNPSTSWTPGVSLQPATQYWWQVAGGVGTDLGPFSPHRSFFTGPECSSASGLAAPVRLNPPDGSQVNEGYAVLRYTPGSPGCIPDAYLVDLQTDQSFAGTNLLGESGIPGTADITDALDDCTIYWWRVAAIQDGTTGPFSDVGWFRTNQSGTCLMPYFPGRAIKNMNCRLGGGQVFPISHIFMENDPVQILARSYDGYYLYLTNPDGGQCWAPTSFVEPYTDLGDLELRALPPTPTPKPTMKPTAKPLVCRAALPKDQCEAAGGHMSTDLTTAPHCICP